MSVKKFCIQIQIKPGQQSVASCGEMWWMWKKCSRKETLQGILKFMQTVRSHVKYVARLFSRTDSLHLCMWWNAMKKIWSICEKTFVNRQYLTQHMDNWTCTLVTFFHSAFLSVSSNRLLKMVHSCIGQLQLRSWIHDNLCYLTIKSDTGQHSQFLRCLSDILTKFKFQF